MSYACRNCGTVIMEDDENLCAKCKPAESHDTCGRHVIWKEPIASRQSAEKTVPMELVERLRYQGIHTREWIVELFAKFGYKVEEGTP